MAGSGCQECPRISSNEDLCGVDCSERLSGKLNLLRYCPFLENVGRTKIDNAAVQELFAGLLGRPCTVGAGKPIVLFGKEQWVVGVYVDDDDKLAGVSVSDLSLANHAGAALSLVSASMAEEGAKANTVSEELLMNYREILNVGANLYPQAGGVHVRLLDVIFARPKIDSAYVKMIRKPKSRIDTIVKVDGYGSGRISFVATV